ILEALRALPGAEASGATIFLPGVPGSYPTEFKTAEGRAEAEPKIMAQNRFVTPGYFAAMRIPVLAGELCRSEPNLNTLMVNRTFANAYFGGSAAIGRRFAPGRNSPPIEIRGIVGDARETGLDRAPEPVVYWCDAYNEPGTYYLVRTHGSPG